MSIKKDRIALFYSVAGVKGILLHFISKFLPPSRFSRQATLLDFKKHNLKFAEDIWQMLVSLGITCTPSQMNMISEEFLAFSKNQMNHVPHESFPHNWNSGEELRLLLFAFIRLMKPENVVETGTANGYSTAAMAHAFELNGTGKVHTFDIVETSAPYVLPSSRNFIELHRVSGNFRELSLKIKSIGVDTQKGFYLHDADHSYFGQSTDFRIAKALGFTYYISDDVETSLVFCEQALSDSASVLFDGRKFIGASIIH